MVKGTDYTGITIIFRCHDGNGNYVLHKRSATCRDEHGRWDFGGGGLKFGENIEDCLRREIKEEYGADVLEHTYLGHEEVHRIHDDKPTHWIAFRYKVLVDKDTVFNAEPDKKEEIGWFTLDSLPEPLHSVVEKNLSFYKTELI
ncbi:MAG: NUDIX domain-containing protein [Patescibacteria group bacterium]